MKRLRFCFLNDWKGEVLWVRNFHLIPTVAINFHKDYKWESVGILWLGFVVGVYLKQKEVKQPDPKDFVRSLCPNCKGIDRKATLNEDGKTVTCRGCGHKYPFKELPKGLKLPTDNV